MATWPRAAASEQRDLGGEGIGGGISNPGILSVTGSIFRHNQAIGGNGNGNVGSFLPGSAEGGAISSGGPSLSVTESTFDHNQAIGGNDNVGGSAIRGPNVAAAGAVGILGGNVTIGDSTFDHNQALGGQGAAGSDGGVGAGGGIAVVNFFFTPSSESVMVSGCTVDHNSAIGGPGGSGGNGGDGSGGGFANTLGWTLKVSSTTVDHNKAQGGDGAPAATAAMAWVAACTTTPPPPSPSRAARSTTTRPSAAAPAAWASAAGSTPTPSARSPSTAPPSSRRTTPPPATTISSAEWRWSLILSPWCSASPPQLVARPSHQGRGPWGGWWGRLRLRSAGHPQAPNGCERTNQALAFGNAFVRSLVTGFLILIHQPRCRRRQASARIVSGGGAISPVSLHSANLRGLPATFGGRATDPPHSPVGSVRATEGSSSPRRPSLCSFARR